MVVFHATLFIAGLILLVKGADYFVEAASRIARALGVSNFIIGLTLVAFGTSIPELAASIVASSNKLSDFVIGNVVGSNIANIGLIIGVSATIKAIKAKKQMLNRDGYIMVLISAIFYVLILNGTLSRWESVFFLLLYFAYIMFLLKSRELEDVHVGEFLTYFLKMSYLVTLKQQVMDQFNHHLNKKIQWSRHIFLDFVIIVAAGFAIVFGARFLVNEAVWFAEFFGVSAGLIGLTVVAVGTSLPELAVSVTAVKKNYGGMVLGNILGSNVANILLVAGAAAFINPLTITKDVLVYSGPFMLILSGLLLYVIKSKWQIRNYEGIIFLVLYTAFITFAFLRL